MKRWQRWLIIAVAVPLSLPVVLPLLYVGIMLLLGASWNTNTGDGREGYAVVHSPDGRFRLVVHGYGRSLLSSLPMMMPGQGGAGGPGYVVLKDRYGRELARGEMESIESIHGGVYWFDDEVHIKFVATWPLPPDDTAAPTPPSSLPQR